MTVKPPPFTALRAIEAAVRHRSYTWAAQELAITHSAVSQAIKRLEGQLGTKLFQRRGGAMEPSPAALQLARAYADAAGALQRSLADISHAPPPNRLAIAMPSDFGRLWFTPRLASLSAAMPDLAVEIRTHHGETAAAVEDSDLLIRMGLPEGPGWTAESLFDLRLMPLCSPGFAERFGILQPQDVLRVPLIAQRGIPWHIWLESAGVRPSTPPRGHVFDDAVMMLEAAARGDGLALAPLTLAESHLRSGALTAPIDHDVATEEQMFVAWRREADEANLIARFVEWFRGEILQSRRTTRQRLTRA